MTIYPSFSSNLTQMCLYPKTDKKEQGNLIDVPYKIRLMPTIGKDLFIARLSVSFSQGLKRILVGDGETLYSLVNFHKKNMKTFYKLPVIIM